jgi:hypothetical protein
MFRCPRTGYIAQGEKHESEAECESESYQAVHCEACRSTHLVDPSTGDVRDTDAGQLRRDWSLRSMKSKIDYTPD